MADLPEISKITLPTGTTYRIKDEVARQGMSGAIVLRGTTTTALTDGATTNPITLDTTPPTEYTAVANDAVFYGNKEFVFDGTNWHEFGDMSGVRNMGKVDQGTVTIKPKGSNSSSAVSFGAHTTATVLKSTVTATVPKVTSTTKYLTASASGTAVGVATSGSAITSLGDASTDTFVKSYPGATSKLETTTVTGVSGSTTASKATAGTAKNVATTGTAVTVASGSLGTETSTRTANTPMWGASVSNETLSFTFKPISTTSVTPAVANGTITPYTFADVTVPKAASAATTVATGSLAANGSGSSVMTGLGTATTGNAVTGYTEPSTETFAKTVSVTTQPTISLSAGASTSTGAVTYVQQVSESGTNNVTFATTGNTAAAITALGTATAAGQTFNGTQETYDVNPKPLS